MNMTLTQRVAPLLITTLLVAAPAWAQTTGSQTMQRESSDTMSTAPSGTARKAAPQSSNSATARQPGETMQSLVERRIADLHGRLNITPRQSQPWDQFAQAMRDNAQEMDSAFRQRAETIGSMSAVENLQSYAQMERQRAQEVQKLIPPFQNLYSALSDQQKKTADEMFRTYAGKDQSARQAMTK